MFSVLDMVVSSASMRKLSILLACAKSLMYSSSPMIKPCGTPVVIDSIFDLLLISMYCL